MDNWLADYHHALQFRLLGLAVVFGLLWPGLALVIGGFRSASLRARDVWNGARTWRSGVL